jgi:hypothetical protein
MHVLTPSVPILWGVPPWGGGGAVGPLVVGGASCLYDSYFKQNMDAG